MIYQFIYYILFISSLTATPYVVFRYIMAGDEYSGVFYPLFWIFGLTFLISYFWISLNGFYRCFVLSKKKDKWNPWNLIKSVHSVMISAIYGSLYLSIFGLIGYVIGTVTLDNVPQVKDVFMAVMHIPVLEYILKGVPLTLGAFIGRLLTSWCIDVQC